MHQLLYIIGILGFLAGWLVATVSQSAIHEILAMLAFILAAICISGGGIISALQGVKKAVEDAGNK